ncbi:ABC transporter ATP-binding protein [Vicingus serpentipes]|uniref:ABC transporter ATP-binding protein n=1 Tax=Vicingus serpentipes TaxID=1926625 RepID=A0A5C6RT52_9FLAO|nr:ABC transporter ATP-binding protein [Vicingus serpentipes]TXB65317.1 ABC transporter ATP-binding protein [Vicingus serpentipes]
MIIIENIHKSYGDLKVLKGVNLTIEQGKIVSIVGASGAGKSTLLQIIGTLDLPDEGSVKINEVVANKLNDKQLSLFRNKNIGFVFQFHHLLPEFTALENICIPAYIHKTPKPEAEKKAFELLAILGLSERANHKPSELSGGEQQRVAVCRALINNPSVILADEPSGNLDSASAKDLHELFFKLRKEFNQTFIIVTHNEDLANMADQKLVMKDGNIVE